MSTWQFTLRSDSFHRVDASPIQRQRLHDKTLGEIERMELLVDHELCAVADFFQVTITDSDRDRVVFSGELAGVDGLATEHDTGEFLINGNAGDHVGSGMTGGTVRVTGNAGEQLAAPAGGHRLGMSGGQVVVDGEVGKFAGHRMRRGTIWINGSAAGHLGAGMVAGTIVVAGRIGQHCGLAMQRGTLIVSSLTVESHSLPRFSIPVPFDAGFAKLLVPHVPPHHRSAALLDRVIANAQRVRGDRCVGGQGEILFPGSPE